MSSAVALLSGGLDSTVAVALWLERGNALSLCLTADYGQRSAAKELMTARALAERFGAPWSAVPLPWLGEAAAVSGSALVDEAEQLLEDFSQRLDQAFREADDKKPISTVGRHAEKLWCEAPGSAIQPQRR